MVLSSDEPPIVRFKEELKDDLNTFNRQLMEEYDVMKEFFTTEFKQKLKEKKTHEESDIHNESASVGDVALIRDKFKVETRNNDLYLGKLFKSRMNKFLMQMVWIKWRNYTRHTKLVNYNLRKFEHTKRQKQFRLLFDAWRSQVHFDYKKKQIDLKPFYYKQRKTEVIDEWDNLIAGLRGYVEQLQMEIKVEVNAKAELIKLYESVMNGSVVKFKRENEFTAQVNEMRQTSGNDTFGRDLRESDNFRSVNIGRLTLLKEQEDPEEEEAKGQH